MFRFEKQVEQRKPERFFADTVVWKGRVVLPSVPKELRQTDVPFPLWRLLRLPLEGRFGTSPPPCPGLGYADK